MKLILYNNFSESNKLNKNIVKIIELDGTLREASSIINPSIVIELNPTTLKDYVVDDSKEYVLYNGIKITWNSFIYNYVLSCNYVKIVEFNRYYFINDIISIRNNLWRLDMHFDALMSYKENIKDLKALITRNEFTFDESIEDNKMPFKFHQNINVINIDYVARKIIFSPSRDNPYSYPTATVGITYLNDMLDYAEEPYEIESPVSYLPSIKSSALGHDCFSKFRFIKVIDVENIAPYLLEHESDTSFIVSLIAYPFFIPCELVQEDELRIGKHTFDGVNTYTGETWGIGQVSGSISPYFLMAEFNGSDIMDDTFLSYEPYSKYEIYLAYYGYTEIKSSDLKDSTIKIFYSFQWDKGIAIINICNDTKGYVIKSVTAQVGTSIAVNRTNQQQLNDERIQMAIKGVIGVTSGAVAIGLSGGNPVSIAGGVMKIGSTIADIGSKLATQHERASTSNDSGSDGCYGTQNCLLKITRMETKEPEDYKMLYGKPLNECKRIGDLEGYTEVDDIHIEDIGSITSDEFDELYSLLTKGFII